MDGGKERGTEGGTGGWAGGVGRDGSQKTRTPHRDVGNKKSSLCTGLLSAVTHRALVSDDVTLSLGRSTVPLELMATLNLMDLHFLFRFPYLYS